MCESTPATIDGEHYARPSYCEDKVICSHQPIEITRRNLHIHQGVLGIYGVFDIADEQCECSCIDL